MAPVTIENRFTGEKVVFPGPANSAADRLDLDLFGPAGCEGVPVHAHPQQEEGFAVVRGTLHLEIDGQQRTLGPGDTAVVPKGASHRWWVGDDGDLFAKAWLSPALHFQEFLEIAFAAMNASDDGDPAPLDGAYFLHKNRDEYVALFLPRPLRLLMPLLYAIGRVTGRHRRFESQLAAAISQPAAQVISAD
jgi:hypothetical protein